MAKHGKESYAPHKGMHDSKVGGNKGSAAKIVHDAGHCDSGGSAETSKAAAGLNAGNKKGGLPAN